MFDVVKSKIARAHPSPSDLIAAALAHQIRLAVAPEFVVELERNTRGEEFDPILRLRVNCRA